MVDLPDIGIFQRGTEQVLIVVDEGETCSNGLLTAFIGKADSRIVKRDCDYGIKIETGPGDRFGRAGTAGQQDSI